MEDLNLEAKRRGYSPDDPFYFKWGGSDPHHLRASQPQEISTKRNGKSTEDAQEKTVMMETSKESYDKMRGQNMHQRRQGARGHKKGKLTEEWRKLAAKNKISNDMGEQRTQKRRKHQEGR